jgi:hypothetical protein
MMDMALKDVIVMNVTRYMVEKKIFEDYDIAFSRPELAGKIALVFRGYDDDEREVYQIPEIVDWVVRFNRKVPHSLFYMSKLFPNSLAAYVLCLCANETPVSVLPNGQQHVSMKVIARVAMDLVENGMNYAMKADPVKTRTHVLRMQANMKEAIGL